MEGHFHVPTNRGDICIVGVYFVKFFTLVMKFRSVLEDATNEVLNKVLKLGVERHKKVFATAIAASNRVLPRFGWVADSGPLAVSSQ